MWELLGIWPLCYIICTCWHFLRLGEKFIIHFRQGFLSKQVTASHWSLQSKRFLHICCLQATSVASESMQDHSEDSHHTSHRHVQDERLPIISHYFLAPLSFRGYLYFSVTNLRGEENVCLCTLSRDVCPLKSTLSFPWINIPPPFAGWCAHVTVF